MTIKEAIEIMTPKEMIAVLTAFENGQAIEARGGSSYSQWEPTATPVWNFHNYNYRVKPEIKERFLTVTELWGKTLINKNGNMCLVYSGNPSNNTIWNGVDWDTVEELHNMDWRVAGPDYDYNTANSLKTV